MNIKQQKIYLTILITFQVNGMADMVFGIGNGKNQTIQYKKHEIFKNYNYINSN